MKVSAKEFEKRIVPDECPDASYLEQEGMGFEDRLESYRNGDFGFVGVRAEIELAIPCGAGAILQTIKSPGLWGIEDDSDASYFEEVFQEECDILAGMLRELGVEVTV